MTLFAHQISTTKFTECFAVNINKHRVKVKQAKKSAAAKPNRVSGYTQSLVRLKGAGIPAHIYSILLQITSRKL